MAGVTTTMERQLPNGKMKIDLFYLDPSPPVVNERYVMTDTTSIQPYHNNSNALPDTKKHLEKAAKVKIQKCRDAATDRRARVTATILLVHILLLERHHATQPNGSRTLKQQRRTTRSTFPSWIGSSQQFGERIIFSIARETAKAPHHHGR
jgi:hypothetical protein